MNQKKLLIKYCILQGLFWAICCASSGSINTYLYGIGVETGAIGLLSGLAGVTATLIQPVLGGFADKYPKYGWKFMLQMFSVLLFVSYILLKLTASQFISGILMAATFMAVYGMFPFINSITFYYEEEGIVLNYGASRGVGSLCSAATSYFIGAAVAKIGVSVITTTGLVLTALFFGMLFTFPHAHGKEKIVRPLSNETAERDTENHSTISFFKEYPAFFAILFGFVCVFCAQMLGNGYILQICESLGGGTKEMGIAQAISAIVELPIMFGFSAIIKRIHSYKLLRIASIAFLLKAVCYLFASSVFILYVAQILQMFSYGLFTMSAVYYVNEIVRGGNKLKGQALLGSATSIGGPAGNFFGGILIQAFGLKTDLTVAVVLAVIGVASVFAAAHIKNGNFSGKKEC